jgi:hypothetical protein
LGLAIAGECARTLTTSVLNDYQLTRHDRGTSLVLLADMAAALGVIILACAFLDLSEEGFLLLTGITLTLALLVGSLLAHPRVGRTAQKPEINMDSNPFRL